MTDETFDEGIAELLAVFPSLQTNRMTLQIWRRLLRDLEDEAFLQAVRRICLETREIYPNTNLMALIREYASGGRDLLRNRALLAWQDVVHALKRIGSYESVAFSDLVIHSCVIALGGWIFLGNVPLEELHWQEKKFIELYAVYSGQMAHPPYLVGRTELQNRSLGFEGHIPLPVAALPENIGQLKACAIANGNGGNR